jgi:RNA polymerase sigma-70 factor (ECF subfamily)
VFSGKERALTDDLGRAADLYRLHGPAVFRRCLRLLRDPDSARDATQEVFVKLVREMDRLSDRETVLPWIYRVATNHCLNVRRDACRRGEEELQPDLAVSERSGAASYPDRALARQVLARFDVATQAVAIGVLVDGMEQVELAHSLGISRRTVARRLERFLEGARRFVAGN